MSIMYIKTQLLLMLLVYNIITAENVIENKNALEDNTYNEETKQHENINGTIRLTKLQNIIHNSENPDYTEHELNIITGNVTENFKDLENNDNTTVFHNITIEKENNGNTTLFHNITIEKENNDNVTQFHNITIEKQNKSALQNGVNNTNNINKSVTIAPNIPLMDEFKEKSNTSARTSKILHFSSDGIPFSNSLHEDVGNFIDLDLNQLSIENLQRLNTFTKISDYASFFGLDITEEDSETIDIGSANGTVIRDEGSASLFLASSLGRGDRILEAYNSENDIVSGVFASCQPELQTVILDEPLGTMYLPGCVRLRRCGGCCMGNLLECRPSKVEPVKIKVLKVNQNPYKSIMSQPKSNHGRARGRGRIARSSRRQQSRNRAKLHIVNEWQHTACACQCKVQPHHCHPDRQDYSPNECACVCKNRSDEKLCYSHSSSHFWDKSSCSCKCKRTLECSTGEFFNTYSCRCSKQMEETKTG